MDRNTIQLVAADQNLALRADVVGEIERKIDFQRHLALPEISVLVGVRRCGKSVALRQIAKHVAADTPVHYLNFEDPRLVTFKVDDFQTAYELFLVANPNAAHGAVIMYDEVQNVEGWERWVGGLTLQPQLKVIVTGSNSKVLGTELATHLTGRHLVLPVTPFSFSEILPGYSNALAVEPHERYSTAAVIARRRAMRDYLARGGFPRVFLGGDNELLKQHYDDIVLKDIVVRKRLKRPDALRDIGSVLASQNTRLFNRSKVVKDVGLKDQVTVGKFCKFFEETFLYRELRMYSRSRRSQLRSLSKFYAVDHNLARVNGFHHSTGEDWVFENAVLNELLRRGRDIFYWHSRQGLEVDFIVRSPSGALTAIQVAQSVDLEQTIERECRALRAAKQELGVEELVLITEEVLQQPLPTDLKVSTIPFYDWALWDGLT